MSTITAEQAAAITAYLDTHHLPKGIGTKQAACSVAAINLALTGRLIDTIPDCMSEVVGRWIIRTQDGLDDATRNSAAWKALLPLAAGTGRDDEKARHAIVLDAMWEALAWVQPEADKRGFGDKWEAMLTERTAYAAAYAATYAAAAAADAADAAAVAADSAADSAADAAYAAAAAYAAYGEWAIRTLERLVA